MAWYYKIMGVLLYAIWAMSYVPLNVADIDTSKWEKCWGFIEMFEFIKVQI